MNQIVCEICGSSNWMKQDGVFVCQDCGMKYSAGEFKQRILAGTETKNRSAIVANSPSHAHIARPKETWEETENDDNLVKRNGPTKIEEIFYNSYNRTKRAFENSNFSEQKAALRILQNAVSIIADHYDITQEHAQKEILQQISNDILVLAASDDRYDRKTNKSDAEKWNDKAEIRKQQNDLEYTFCIALGDIAQKYPDTQKEHRLFFYHLALTHAEFILRHGAFENSEQLQTIIMGYHRLINWIEPAHRIPPNVPTAPSSGACSIATCVYGSYDCPQVWILRRYRDNTLAATWYGRAFIHIYYAISPTVVKRFGHTAWFQNWWKKKLDKLVFKLHRNGVEDTPYSDRNW